MAGLLVLIGVEGRTWLGDVGERAVDDPDPNSESAEQSSGRARLPAPAASVPPADRPAAGGAPGLGESLAASDTTAADPDRGLGEAAVADRLWGCLKRAEAARAAGDLAAAFSAATDAAALPLDQGQRQRVDEQLAALRGDVERRIGTAAESVRAGRVLSAARELRPLASAGRPELRTALANLAAARSWPSLTGAVDEALLPDEPAPPARGVRVRVLRDDEWLVGRVVGARDGGVTVRLDSASGVFYPTLAPTEFEPVDADGAASLDHAAWALRAGDPLLAALWLACAAERASVDSIRLERLGRCLVPGVAPAPAERPR